MTLRPHAHCRCVSDLAHSFTMMGSAGICVLIKDPRCAGPDVEGVVPNEILPSNDAGYDERYLFGIAAHRVADLASALFFWFNAFFLR